MHVSGNGRSTRSAKPPPRAPPDPAHERGHPETNPVRSLVVFLCLVVGAWTLTLGGSLAWNLKSQKEEMIRVARVQALSEWRKDVLYRRWNAQNSPLYVATSDKTPPNPLLAHVPERDLVTPSGRKLTLVNPAYMTREVHELGKADGVNGHITSLRPIRPQNAPDAWERRALETFLSGVTEVSSVALLPGGPHLRLMRPLLTEESCLKCHAAQGYKVGDLRGGISVAVPLRPLYDAGEPHRRFLIVGHASLWALGLAGLYAGGRVSVKQVRARIAAEGEKIALERQLSESRRLGALGTLAGGLAHRFNNLLLVVSGRAELARDEALGAGRPTADLDAILASGALAAALVEKLGALAPLEDVASGATAVAPSFHRALEALKAHGAAPLAIRETICDGAVVTLAHEELDAVLSALLSNAFDSVATTGGEVSFTVKPWPPCASELPADSREPACQGFLVTVEDTGSGIAPDVLPHVFEPFFTTKDVGKGDGLGLSVARAIVQRRGGRLDLESEPGRGTRVRLWLAAA